MTGTCLDEETTLGLVEGRLAAASLDQAEAHLDGCDRCRDVVAQLAKANAPASRELVRGQQLGKYVVGELLGAGAMGGVYSAWQPELDRKVAIKVLHEQGGATDRLLKEAQAMARLDHPNVVGVHEVSTLDDGGIYVVMDLVEGDTLGAWAQETRHDWREIVRVLIEIARGLAAVHAAGVIHRDIKPDNIIVGSDGRARLGDFGLARGAGTKVRAGKLADSASFEDTVVATPSDRGVAMVRSPVAASGTAVAGTPVYMALELLQGKPATPASDQFAFGVTAYEIVAGRRPFTGKTWSDLAAAIERDPPAPLRDVPGWLDAAIRRCFAVDPQKRFASFAAVADHLAERAQRRKPIWIAGAAAAAMVASGVTWAATRGGDAPAAGPSCAIGANEIALVWNSTARVGVDALGPPVLAALDGWSTKWAAEHDATCEAAGTAPIAKTTARERCLTRQRDEVAALLDRSRQVLADPVSQPGAFLIGRGDDVHLAAWRGEQMPELFLDALAGMPPADCRLAEAGTDDPLPASSDRASEARTVERELPKIRAAIALGDARTVIDLSAAMVERARTSTHAPSLAEALLVRGEALRATDQLADAAIAARDALAAAERGHDDQTAARAWILRVGVATDRRELADADDLGAVADGAIARAGSPARLVTQLLRARGLIAYYRNRFDDARTLLAKARAGYVALSGERSTDVSSIETLLGATARASGDLDAAERHHRAALAIDRELRGPDHFDLSRDLHNLAGVLRLRKQLDAAAATYQQALAIEIAKRGERSVQAGLTHNSLGLVKLERGDHPGARAEFALALDILSAANHGDRAFAEHNLGLVSAAQGDHAAAFAHYDRAATIYTATIGDTALQPIRLHLDRARSFASLGRRDQARASAAKALDGALTADIPWIVDDAKALLAKLAPPVAVAPPVVRPNLPRPEIPPLPPDPPRPPVPIKDVGTYGSSPGRN